MRDKTLFRVIKLFSLSHCRQIVPTIFILQVSKYCFEKLLILHPQLSRFTFIFKMIYRPICLLIAALIAILVSQSNAYQAKMVVKGEKVKEQLSKKEFHLSAASLSNQMHSSKKQIIKIIVADPVDGCTSYQKAGTKESFPVFYLVQGREGQCTYTKKAHNARKGLANGIIIIDSEKGLNNLNMLSNKDYFQVFLLPQNQGDQLVESAPSSFLAQVTPEDYFQNRLYAEIWVSSLNKKSYEVMQWWKNTLTSIPSIGTKLSWAPRFAYISCKNGSGSCGGQFVSCACSGDFCSPEKRTVTPYQDGKTSNVLVRQDIRQNIIFKDHSEQYLQYTQLFAKRCLDNYIQQNIAEDCANSVLSTLQIDASAISQRIDNFLHVCFGDGQTATLYQSMVLDRNKFNQIRHYPTIILNYQVLNVQSQSDLKSTLCRKLGLDKSEGCSDQSIIKKVVTTVVGGIFWLIVFTILLGGGTLAVVYFRNRLRRQMNKQLKMQVSTAVQHYFQLSESSATK